MRPIPPSVARRTETDCANAKQHGKAPGFRDEIQYGKLQPHGQGWKIMSAGIEHGHSPDSFEHRGRYDDPVKYGVHALGSNSQIVL